MIARRFVVRGEVQGVGYRYWLIEAAHAIDVAGWVRNRRDGSVEGFAQGNAPEVERMLSFARRGPPAARVTDVEVDPVDPDPSLDDFALRPTL